MNLPRIYITPGGVINYTCLLITAIAPYITLGLIGIPLGIVAAAGLAMCMQYAASEYRTLRVAAQWGVWLVRAFVVCLEQMAYLLGFEMYVQSDRPLPFGLTPSDWAWLSVLFMAALDVWAYTSKAIKVAAVTEAAKQAAELERLDALDRERAERKQAEEDRKREHELALAKIAAETERIRAAKEAEAATEATRLRAEADRKRAELEAEARKIEAEAKRKTAEETRKQAEVQAEAERKRQKAQQKQQEAAEAEQERQLAEKERIMQLETEKQRRDQEAETEAANASAGKRERFRLASGEDRRKIVAEAEVKLTSDLGRMPTQQEIAEEAGTSDRTVREYQKERNPQLQQLQSPA